jgi:type VI secretion system secreted protein Hcp
MAYAFSVTIKGQKQGDFKGEGTSQTTKNAIEGLSFAYDLKSPRDVSTGHATGKRQHSPIRIVKGWGAATPQIFQALVQNEALTSVKLEFRKTNASGEEFVYYTITLTNASVSGIRQFSREATDSSSSGKHAATDPQELEEVSFTFEKISVENHQAKTTGQDDWHTAGS